MGLKVVPKKAKPAAKAGQPKKQKPPAAAKPKPKAPSRAVNPTPGPMVSARDLEYMAEDDARTLMRAEEIKRDAARLRKAKAVAKKKADEASKVANL